MLKALQNYFKKIQQRKSCSHFWELYDIIPVMDREGLDERQDVYKIRCLKCGHKQRRSFWGIDRLQKLGRIQEGRAGWNAEEMAEIVYKGVMKARRGEGTA